MEHSKAALPMAWSRKVEDTLLEEIVIVDVVQVR